MVALRKQEPKYISLKKAAEHLEVPYTTLLDWARSKKFPAYRQGGRWRVIKAEMLEWEKKSKNTEE